MLRRPSVVCPSVRPSSVRPSSTISKIFFSETAGPIVLILHIHHLQVGGKNNCVFCFDRIRTLVAMATYASHRLIMEKSENCQFLAHLSRRLIDELIVYPCSSIRPSVRRPSVVRRRPQFQRSSSPKPLGRLFSYYTYTIYR